MSSVQMDGWPANFGKDKLLVISFFAHRLQRKGHFGLVGRKRHSFMQIIYDVEWRMYQGRISRWLPSEIIRKGNKSGATRDLIHLQCWGQDTKKWLVISDWFLSEKFNLYCRERNGNNCLKSSASLLSLPLLRPALVMSLKDHGSVKYYPVNSSSAIPWTRLDANWGASSSSYSSWPLPSFICPSKHVVCSFVSSFTCDWIYDTDTSKHSFTWRSILEETIKCPIKLYSLTRLLLFYNSSWIYCIRQKRREREGEKETAVSAREAGD